MSQFTVKNLINACQNQIDKIKVFRITSDIAYDPEEDTVKIFEGTMKEIDNDLLKEEVQDFYVDYSLIIYV